MEYILQEDVSRQKRASEIIKIASMEDECWASLEDIYNRYPRQRSYIFNDLCQLCKEQALPLLRKVADGTLKPAALPYHSKLLPLPPADIPLIVQVGRKKEKNARTNQVKPHFVNLWQNRKKWPFKY